MSEEREKPESQDSGGDFDLEEEYLEEDDLAEEDLSEELKPSGGDADKASPEQIEEQPERTRRERPGRRERQAEREIRELRERVERQERDLSLSRQTQQQPRVDPYEAQRREQQWREQVSMLPPDQAAAAWAERTRNEVSQALIGQQQTLTDQIDRTSWDAACRSDPVRARFTGQVEQVMSTMPPSAARNRETIFTYLYGQEALRQRNQGSAKQRLSAKRRVDAQTTKPGAARSDGTRERGQGRGDFNSLSTEERWARLRNSSARLG